MSCVKTAAYDVSVAKLYKVKSLEKLGVFNAGALMIAYLISPKDSFYLCPHLNTKFFLIIFFIGKTIKEKSGMNLFTKLICPRNDCMDFLL